jgi:hypothetical protein
MRRAAIVVLGLALFALGCDETTQSPFIVRVSDINNGGSTLLADVIQIDTQTGQVTIPTELVPVVITNRAYSSNVVTDPGTLWYDFQVKRYAVRWRWMGTAIPGVDLTQFDHTEETTLLVPFDGEATLFALLVPLSMKVTPPFADLPTTGGSIGLVADLDFVGAPAIDLGNEIHIRTSLSVSFADFADKKQ